MNIYQNIFPILNYNLDWENNTPSKDNIGRKG
jgi:hypothetical protein